MYFNNDIFYKSDANLEKWLAENVVRSFGVCFSIRDESFNLSAKEIYEKLKADDTSRVNYLKESLSNYQDMDIPTEEELQTLYLKEREYLSEKSKVIDEQVTSFNGNYVKCKAIIEKLKASDNEVAHGIAKQLEERLQQACTTLNEKKSTIDQERRNLKPFEEFKKDHLAWIANHNKYNADRRDEILEQIRESNISDNAEVYKDFLNVLGISEVLNG